MELSLCCEVDVEKVATEVNPIVYYLIKQIILTIHGKILCRKFFLPQKFQQCTSVHAMSPVTIFKCSCIGVELCSYKFKLNIIQLECVVSYWHIWSQFNANSQSLILVCNLLTCPCKNFYVFNCQCFACILWYMKNVEVFVKQCCS